MIIWWLFAFFFRRVLGWTVDYDDVRHDENLEAMSDGLKFYRS